MSPLLQKKFKIMSLSAGRFKSAALGLIVDQKLAIENFEKKKEFIIQGTVEIEGEKFTLRQKDEEGSLIIYASQEEAEKVRFQLDSEFKLLREERKEKYIFPKPPFTTSRLLYEAVSQLGFSIAKTTN